MRRQLTQKDKKEIGTECCNCGSTKELEYHHIIPISLGGNDINSNMVCLCYPCHQKIHYGESKHGLHSTIIKKGIENARAKGKQIGRKKTTEESIPQSFFRYYPQFVKGNINLSEFARLSRLSRNSVYKYLKIVDGK